MKSKSHGPWKILKRKKEYSNKFGLSIYEDSVIKPNGSQGKYSWVSFFPSVSILPIDNKNNVYLAKEFKYGTRKYAISVPGGTINKNESPLRAAKRELKEELGISAKSWKSLGKFYSSPANVDNLTYTFIARNITISKQSLDPTENIKILKMPLSKAIMKIKKNEITGSLSTALILKANLK